MRFTPQLLPSRSGNVGILMLNHAKALNALSLEMIHCMQDVLNEWVKHDHNNTDAADVPRAILIKSNNVAGAKVPAFCAGGDVKRVVQSAMREKETTTTTGMVGQGQHGLESADFFRYEYQVNHTLATLSTSSLQGKHPKGTTRNDDNNDNNKNDPIVVSFWDGIVMGGGVGISIYGKYRVATERTVWAMPETGIGFFPDVGSLYWMPRLFSSSPAMATYLALSGRRLHAADLLYTGLATHYVPSPQLPALEQALIEASNTTTANDARDDFLAPVLMSFHQSTPVDPQHCSLAQDAAAIAKYFDRTWDDKNSVHHVMQVLSTAATNGDKFARQTLETLHKMSPSSLAITWEGLRRGAQMPNMAEHFAMEFRLGQACLRNADFYEGIRAALIDKDQKPAWQPSSLDSITPEVIASYFAPVEHEWSLEPNHSKM